MRYWDEDHPEWDAEERDFAAAWRSQPKWVVSRSLKSVGPNATLIEDDIEAVIRGLKNDLSGEIQVGGPDLARSLTEVGLIDEYQTLLPPRRAWPRQAVLRRPPAAAPPYGQRFDRRGCDQVDVRSCLIARLARRAAPTRQVRFGSKADNRTRTRRVRFTPLSGRMLRQVSISAMGQKRTFEWASGSSAYLDGFTPRDRSRNRCAVT